MKNDYYSIACENLKFLQSSIRLKEPFYNNFAVLAQQIAEFLLKSVAERVCIEIEKLMQSHNLRALYQEIKKCDSMYVLDKYKLSMLKDFYFDAKYPGDNFIEVDKETCNDCLDIMYGVLMQTNLFRERMELEIQEFQIIKITDSDTMELF